MPLLSLKFAQAITLLSRRWFVSPNTRARYSPLRGEELESRCVPAKYLWAYNGGGAGTWGEASNWRMENEGDRKAAWDFAPTAPGAGDDVIFAGSLTTAGGHPYKFNSDCVIRTATTVRSITFINGYTKELELKKDLTLVEADPAKTSASFLNSAAQISGVGAAKGEGKLILAGQTSFNWSTGTLKFLTVEVQRDATAKTKATLKIGANPGSGLPNPKLVATTVNVDGVFTWAAQDVRNDSQWVSKVNVKSGGVFNINAAGGTFGLPVAPAGADSSRLKIDNAAGGLVDFKLQNYTDPQAIIVGNYTTAGTTIIGPGTLKFHNGSVEQTGGSFQLATGKVWLTGLNIRDGHLIGFGTIQGNLVVGYPNRNQPNTTPIVSPGGGGQIGIIAVEGNFQLASGKIDIEVAGPTNYDKIGVTGFAAFTGEDELPGMPVRKRDIEGNLLAAHDAIDKNTQIPFLTYDSRQADPRYVVFTPQTPVWSSDKNNTSFWFFPTDDVAEAKAKVAGRVFRDDGVLAGVFEDGVEALLSGVTVRLFDEAGTIPLASTTTDANGGYEFSGLDAGVYVVKFDRPSGERFAVAHATTDTDLDSDPDPLTGGIRVALYEDQERIDAGLYYDAAPIAVDEASRAHKNGIATGSVLANDTDADGDTLTAAVATGPAHGNLSLTPEGLYVFTPDTDYTGTDSFTYTLSDGYGGTDTGTVTLTVADTPAPVGVADSYSAPGELWVDTEDGVLANDTDQSNGTLFAALVTGPGHGTLVLNPDGSFLYTPNDDFVGTDSFTYRPTDDDGPGVLTTVSIAVTDTPPEAANDTATTDEDTAVTISVLTNDTDADSGDTLAVVAASDGIYGTTLVNSDGTITYTPGANFNGTDSFVYVIDDGHGRYSYATVTVTVAAVNDAPVAADDTFTVLKNGTLTFDPRANDTDADGDALTTVVVQPAHGSVVVNSDGTFTYTPTTGWTGTDTFTYTLSDGNGGTSTATVTVSVVLHASVGGRVWDDDNHDGIQDTGEANRAGVEVRLLDADNNVIATVYTDSTGLFLFDGLLPGQYRIRVVAPIGTETTAQDQGTDDAVDSDVNGGGYSALFTLTAGGTPGLDAGLVPAVLN